MSTLAKAGLDSAFGGSRLRLHNYHFTMELFHWMRATLEVLLIVIGCPGNLLIILVYTSKRGKITAHIFIVGLAVADFVECLSRCFTLFVFLPHNERYINNSEVICRLEYFLPFVSIFISVLFTTAIAFDRYFAVCKPHSHIMTIRRAKVTVVLCILFSLILALPPLGTFGLKNYPVIGRLCVVVAPQYMLQILFINFYVVGICGVLLMIILYAKIYWVLRKRKKVGAVPTTISHTNETSFQSSRAAGSSSENGSSVTNPSQIFNNLDVRQPHFATLSTNSVNPSTDQNLHRETTNKHISGSKTTKMLLITTIVFIVTWIPVLATFAIDRKTEDKIKEKTVIGYNLMRFSRVLMLFNHMVNPFIYGAVNRKFREDTMNLFQKIRQRWCLHIW